MSLSVVDALINEGRKISGAVYENARNLELAQDNECQCRRVAAEAKQAYQDAEAEVLAVAMLNADGKNAEQRKAQVDLVLIRSRQTGELALPYAVMVAADYQWQDAKMALEQAIARFSAVRHVADLHAQMLRAAAD